MRRLSLFSGCRGRHLNPPPSDITFTPKQNIQISFAVFPLLQLVFRSADRLSVHIHMPSVPENRLYARWFEKLYCQRFSIFHFCIKINIMWNRIVESGSGGWYQLQGDIRLLRTAARKTQHPADHQQYAPLSQNTHPPFV